MGGLRVRGDLRSAVKLVLNSSVKVILDVHRRRHPATGKIPDSFY
jgi:hypothetical protein